MICINNLLHGPEYMRLQRMKELKPQYVFSQKLYDNSLRSQIQRLICLRRLKHASLIGQFYWIRGRYQSVGFDFQLHDVGQGKQLATYDSEGDGAQYFHRMRNNLDISDVGTGLGLDLECFSSFLAASVKNDTKRQYVLRARKKSNGNRLKKSDLSKLTELDELNSEIADMRSDLLQEIERQVMREEQATPTEANRELELYGVMDQSTDLYAYLEQISGVYETVADIESTAEEPVLVDIANLYEIHDMSPTQEPEAILDMSVSSEPVEAPDETEQISLTYLHSVLEMHLVKELQMVEELKTLQDLHLMNELQMMQQQTPEQLEAMEVFFERQIAELDPAFAEELARTKRESAQRLVVVKRRAEEISPPPAKRRSRRAVRFSRATA